MMQPLTNPAFHMALQEGHRIGAAARRRALLVGL